MLVRFFYESEEHNSPCNSTCTLQTLPAMQRQVQSLEEKYKDIAQLKNMKEQVEDLKKERVWAEVIEAEKVQQKLSCIL